MSGTSPPPASLPEVFVRLRSDSAGLTAAIDRVTTAVEARDGRVVAAFPPGALIAALPENAVKELTRLDDVEGVQADAFSDAQVEAEVSDLRFIMLAWNDRCATRDSSRPEPFGRGLSWDAPGMLPPDPPAHIREELERRGREGDPDDSEE